ncbi:MAG: hypothetical protein AB7U82_04625 [Blastocatellales bacterium]
MIVYRSTKQTVSVSHLLARFRADLARYERGGLANHDQAVALLVDFGEIEAGVADALSPEMDFDCATLRVFRRTSLLAGRVFCASWRREIDEARPLIGELKRAFDELSLRELPHSAQLSPPEGYAYYGLYPETYLEASVNFIQEQRPRRAVIIGVRGIGASLSAVVGAALAECGVEVDSFTVRPRGHPFDRRLELAPELEDRWRSLAGAHFLIVDEGPGLSGSSLTCVARKLSELGVGDERITFFPSWEPDGSHFVSGAARERWRRHRKNTASFEQVWIESGRLAQSILSEEGACDEMIDLSAGAWRKIFCNDETDYPPSQPQHEQRKYLCRRRGSDEKLWLKFAGLGRYGGQKLERAEALAEAGFAPRVFGLKDGFIASEFVQGRPLRRCDVDRRLLGAIADYLAHLRKNFPSSAGASREELMEMIRINVAEGLGEEWAEKLVKQEGLRAFAGGASITAIDGRMLPHEWLRVKDGFIKTDGVDHHDDHFFPGPQDIAWDIAGTCVEFMLNVEQRNYLINRYRALSSDCGAAERLPFFLIAYPAYRLGYATLASTTLGASTDAARFKTLADRYAALLVIALRNHARHP